MQEKIKEEADREEMNTQEKKKNVVTRRAKKMKEKKLGKKREYV